LEQDDCSSFNSEKKIFDDLVICNEKNFSVGSLNLIEPFTDRLKKNNKVKENLKKLLLLTQQRRSNLINKRLNIKQRWEKMGYKIRE
jgi:monomeric isocitrate dehydrogenase